MNPSSPSHARREALFHIVDLTGLWGRKLRDKETGRIQSCFPGNYTICDNAVGLRVAIHRGKKYISTRKRLSANQKKELIKDKIAKFNSIELAWQVYCMGSNRGRLIDSLRQILGEYPRKESSKKSPRNSLKPLDKKN